MISRRGMIGGFIAAIAVAFQGKLGWPKSESKDIILEFPPKHQGIVCYDVAWKEMKANNIQMGSEFPNIPLGFACAMYGVKAGEVRWTLKARPGSVYAFTYRIVYRGGFGENYVGHWSMAYLWEYQLHAGYQKMPPFAFSKERMP